GADGHAAVRSWRLDEILGLRAKDRSGLGTLELVGSQGRLAHWRYTTGRAASAHRLAQRLEALSRGVLDEDDTWDSADADDERVSPRAAGALFRLLKFGRQRAGLMAAGFVLTLIVTLIGLVPPYLTL